MTPLPEPSLEKTSPENLRAESPPPEPSPENLRAEYQQINECARHDGTLSWASGAILLPASVGAFYVAKDFRRDDWAALSALALVSIFISIFWTATMERYYQVAFTRLKRGHAVEEALQMHHHRNIRDARAKSAWYTKLRTWWFIYPPVITVAWALFILTRSQAKAAATPPPTPCICQCREATPPGSPDARATRPTADAAVPSNSAGSAAPSAARPTPSPGDTTSPTPSKEK